MVRLCDSFWHGVYLCVRHGHCLAVFLFPYILPADAVRLVLHITFACISVGVRLAFGCCLISAPVIQRWMYVGDEHARRAVLIFGSGPGVSGIHPVSWWSHFGNIVSRFGLEATDSYQCGLTDECQGNIFSRSFSWPRFIGAKSRFAF